MKRPNASPAAEPFFLPAKIGARFCLYHAPSPDKTHTGSLIYIHPFAEELNRSRRMAAVQSRAFAKLGIAVLQIDLFGCGDSSGDFGESRWEIWKEDVTNAWNWLELRTSAPIGLWGLRLGALLALDAARDAGNMVDKILLWQPVNNGASFLTQMLRTRLASEMMLGLDGKRFGTQEMRLALAGGSSIEVAGYEINPPLAASIDSLRLPDLIVHDCPIYWLETVPEVGRPIPPAAAHVADAWRKAGVNIHIQSVAGTPFWASQDVMECPALTAATTELFI